MAGLLDETTSYLYALKDGLIHYRTWFIDVAPTEPDPQDHASTSTKHPYDSKHERKKSACDTSLDESQDKSQAVYLELWQRLEAIESHLSPNDAQKQRKGVGLWTWQQCSSIASDQSAAQPATLNMQGAVGDVVHEKSLVLWAFAIDTQGKARLEELSLPGFARSGSSAEMNFDRIYPNRYCWQAPEPAQAHDSAYYHFCVAFEQNLTRQLQQSLSKSGYRTAVSSHGSSLLVSPYPCLRRSEDIEPYLRISFTIQLQPQGISIETETQATRLRRLDGIDIRLRAKLIDRRVILDSVMTGATFLADHPWPLDEKVLDSSSVSVKFALPTTNERNSKLTTAAELITPWPVHGCFVEEEVLKAAERKAQDEVHQNVFPPLFSVARDTCFQIDFEDLDRRMAEPCPTDAELRAQDEIDDDAHHGDDMHDYEGPGMTEDDFSFFDDVPVPFSEYSQNKDHEAEPNLIGLIFNAEQTGNSDATALGVRLRSSETGALTYLQGPAGPTPEKTPGAHEPSPSRTMSPNLGHNVASELPDPIPNYPLSLTTDRQPIKDLIGDTAAPQPTPRSMTTDIDTPHFADIETGTASGQGNSHHMIDALSEQHSPSVSMKSTYCAYPIDTTWSEREGRYRAAHGKELIDPILYAPGRPKKRAAPSDDSASGAKRTMTSSRAPLTPVSVGRYDHSSGEESEEDDDYGPNGPFSSSKESVRDLYVVALPKAIRAGWPIGTRQPGCLDDSIFCNNQMSLEFDELTALINACITEQGFGTVTSKIEPHAVSCPQVTLQRKGDVLRMDATALLDWIPLELAPLNDRKDILTCVLKDKSVNNVEDDDIRDWLDDFESCYSAMNLGSHHRLSGNSSDRVFISIDTSKPPGENKALLQVSSEVCAYLDEQKASSKISEQAELTLFVIPGARSSSTIYDWLQRCGPALRVPIACRACRLAADSLSLPWSALQRQNLALDIYQIAAPPLKSRSAFLLDGEAPVPRFSRVSQSQHLNAFGSGHMLFVGYKITQDNEIRVEWCDQRCEVRASFEVFSESPEGLDMIQDFSWISQVMRKISEFCKTINSLWHVALCKHGVMTHRELSAWNTAFRHCEMLRGRADITLLCCTDGLGNKAPESQSSFMFMQEERGHSASLNFAVTKDYSLLHDASHERSKTKIADLRPPHVGLLALAEAFISTTNCGAFRTCRVYLLSHISERSRATGESEKFRKGESDTITQIAQIHRSLLKEILTRAGPLSHTHVLLQRPKDLTAFGPVAFGH